MKSLKKIPFEVYFALTLLIFVFMVDRGVFSSKNDNDSEITIPNADSLKTDDTWLWFLM